MGRRRLNWIWRMGHRINCQTRKKSGLRRCLLKKTRPMCVVVSPSDHHEGVKNAGVASRTQTRWALPGMGNERLIHIAMV